MVLNEIQSKISVNDCVSFETQFGVKLGVIVDTNTESIDVIVFQRVTSEMSQEHTLRPVTAAEYPVAYHGNMAEVLARVTERLSIFRLSVVDIIFIVPISEVESGLFHVAGSRMAYFTRYVIKDNGARSQCSLKFYYNRHTVEPFSHRLFLSFNHLAQNLKRGMYHLKESATTKKSFRFFFPMEYLCSKVPSGVKATVMRRESSILYYNNLQMESRSVPITNSYLHVLDKRSMSELRHLIGDGN
jgi:hypothetical protein